MSLDGRLGVYPSLVMAQFYEIMPEFLHLLIDAAYLALPLAVMIIQSRKQNCLNNDSYDVLPEFICTGIFGYLFYFLVPACGSRYAFAGNWPYELASTFIPTSPKLIYCAVNMPRNCIPSLHTAWMVCLLRHARYCDSMTRLGTGIFSVLTWFGMFVIGAHYLIDIIVGLAFANMMGGIFARQLSLHHRRQIILGGGCLFGVWISIILYGFAWITWSTYIVWGAYFGSISLSIYLESRYGYKHMHLLPYLRDNAVRHSL